MQDLISQIVFSFGPISEGEEEEEVEEEDKNGDTFEQCI